MSTRRKHMAPVWVAAVVIAFVFGIGHLFSLRFERGDIYPPYSSLRTDPLGTKALFKSIEALESVSVLRNHEPLYRMDRIGHLGDTTLLYLGAGTSGLFDFDGAHRHAFRRLAVEGGRLVFSFKPTRPIHTEKSAKSPKKKTGKKAVDDTTDTQRKDGPKSPCSKEASAKPDKKGARKADEKTGAEFLGFLQSRMTLADMWGVDFGYEKWDGEKPPPPKKAVVHQKGLPDAISWHTALYFKPRNRGWKTIYSHQGRPVIIERSYGKGSVVLSADAYLFSNEALRNERRPGLLVWFLGDNHRVIFDESHHGIEKKRGVVDLVRKYRLAGLFFGLVVLAALFVWKNGSCFLPPGKDGRDTGENHVASQRDSTAGVVSLLRRNIPPKSLPEVCFAEWKKSLTRKTGSVPPDQLEKINRILGGSTKKQFDPVAAYQHIFNCLSEEKGKRLRKPHHE